MVVDNRNPNLYLLSHRAHSSKCTLCEKKGELLYPKQCCLPCWNAGMSEQSLTIRVAFSFPIQNEDIIAMMGKIWRRSFPLILFYAPYSVSWNVVAFNLSLLIKPLLPEDTGFVCKELSCIWLFLLSHFHIFTLEFQLLLSNCSSTSLGLPWRVFLGSHSPL